MMFTDMKIRLDRAKICQGCEYYRRSTRQCTECGCLVNFKVMIADTECPKGKWGKVTEGTDMFAEIANQAQKIFFNKEAGSKN
jgi:hypothetical protein